MCQLKIIQHFKFILVKIFLLISSDLLCPEWKRDVRIYVFNYKYSFIHSDIHSLNFGKKSSEVGFLVDIPNHEY